MALKHITLHVTRQEADGSGRRKNVRVKLADSNVPETSDGKALRNVPLLLTHALSKGGEKVTERKGFDYIFEPYGNTPTEGGFELGEENGFPYVFGVSQDQDGVWGFTMTE